MVILNKDRGMGISGKVVEEPFPGGARDCKEVTCRVGNEPFKSMKMVGICFGGNLRGFLLTPPGPIMGFEV